LSHRLQILCARCPHSQRGCQGPCACTVDGRDILEHAAEGYCPLGRYKLGPGDVLAIIFHRTGIRWLVGLLWASCGCESKQKWLNRVWKRLRRLRGE
jgi:hypothetical protein